MSRPLVPQSDEEAIKAIRLYRSPRIGPIAYRKLTFGAQDFTEAFARLEETVRKNHIRNYLPAELATAQAEYEAAQAFGAQIIFDGDPLFPPNLLASPERPPFLWVKGEMGVLERFPLAIIGSRNPSFDGKRLAHHFAKKLSGAGMVIVSGLARGIDTAAHEGALDDALEGGTIGVIAGGLDIRYPKSNAKLQDSIAEKGLLVTEMPMGHKPQAKNFPQRNRIIAALSRGVLVAEAGSRSGTQITVNQALEIGRDILAIPGSPTNSLADLPNALIRDGAELIRDPQDVLAWRDGLRARSLEHGKSEKGEGDKPPSMQGRKRREETKARRDDQPSLANSAEISTMPQELADLGREMIEGRAYQSPDGKFHVSSGED